ncbi:extracellular catalytic domain type 1 short-chain-length polyhydroxyalkanoate depolymerase [Lichenibacterium ramalinae]|uniref:Esterase n=1 Tax=Lichenibacterium ramalinae TaxID=2316527 RepID=A0A4Q2RHA2_9HYPH|nr:PHB depolymerase family esterase [Lichenibacterium ramalinae]RYB06028.1 esterase [Lichenibacterium ramalinae]
MFARSTFAKPAFAKPAFAKPAFAKPAFDLGGFASLPKLAGLAALKMPRGLPDLRDGAGLPPAMRDMLARLGDLAPAAPLCGSAPAAAVAVAVPPGARFEELTHAGPAGTLGYRLYVPARAADGPMPLVVMLHGCTQSPEDFAAGTQMNAVAEAEGILVAYPRQTRAGNAQKCWNWFDPKDQGRDRGEPALIAGMVRDILRDHAADRSRVYVAGLSAGGAAAAILGQAYPDVFAAAGVHSGLAAGAATDMPGAFTAMRGGGRAAPGRAVPTIVFHGSGDHTVAPANAVAVAAQARGGADLAEAVSRGRAEGGLAFTRTVETDPKGLPLVERWLVDGAGHAWSGGSAAGSYTEPRGPDASREMLRFFLRHRLVAGA